MAGSIKGISIVIDGDTRKLDKALKDVNSATRTTETQLRNVEKALKMDPGNVDLIKDKHRLLGDQIKNTQDKLDKLKEAESQQVNAGAANTDDFKALETEIDTTKAKLEQLKEADKSLRFEGLKKASDSLKSVSDKAEKVGGALTKGVTAPILAAGTASGVAFKEVDSAMDSIVTKTGASGPALEDMQNRAKSMAETIPTTFENASDAVAETNVRFGLTGDALETLSTQFVEFAEVNDTDVTSSVENLQQVMSAFGVDASDAGNMLGLFTSVSQKTGVSVDDLMSSLQANGSTFRDLGLSASESTTLLGNFEAAGVDDATALEAMKKAAANFQSQGISLSDGLSDIIGKLSDGQVTTDDYTEAMKIFGKKGGDAFVDMAKSGRLSLDNLQTDLSGYGTTVSDTFNGTLDPIDQATTAFNKLKDVGASIFESIESVLAPALDEVSAKLQDFKAWWDALDPAMQQNIIKIALIAAAIGPVIILIGKIAGAVSAIANPVGLVVTAIAAVVGGVIALYNNCQPFKDFVDNLISKVKSFFTDTKGGLAQIQQFMQPAVSALYDAFQKIWSLLQPALEQLKSALAPIIADVQQKIGPAIQSLLSLVQGIFGAVGPIFSAIGGALTFIIGLITALIDLLTGNFSGAAQAVQTAFSGLIAFFQGIWDGICSIFSGVVAYFESRFTGSAVSTEQAWSDITSFFSGVWDGICGAFSAVGSFFSTTFSGAVQNTKAEWGDIGAFFSGIWDNITRAFSSVGSFFSDTFQGAVDGIHNAFSGIDSWFSGLFSNIHIALPHFSINGSFSLAPPSIPTIGINWYANGGILKAPTVFGAMGNTLLAGGEAGPEAVAPISELQKYLGGSGTTYNIYIDGARVNDDPQIAKVFSESIKELCRKGRSNVG